MSPKEEKSVCVDLNERILFYRSSESEEVAVFNRFTGSTHLVDGFTALILERLNSRSETLEASVETLKHALPQQRRACDETIKRIVEELIKLDLVVNN